MDTPSISLSDTDVQPITLSDADAPPIPQPQAAATRAAKVSYALGNDAPDYATLTQAIMSGQEPDLRRTVAAQEKNKLVEAKTALVNHTVQNYGNQLTPGGARAVVEVHNLDPVVDPDTILEKVFSDKYTQDVLGLAPDHVASDPAVQRALPEESEVLSGMQMGRQYYQTQLENLQGQKETESGITWLKNIVVESIPFVPWYRQAQALNRPSSLTFLPGQTMKDNVQWMYTQPLSVQKQLYKQAMDYYDKSGNIEDKIAFTQALLSFSTSDEYIANAMGLADYGTVLAPVAKGLAKAIFKSAAGVAADAAATGAKEAVAEAEKAAGAKVPTEYYKDASLLKRPTAPSEEQLDLFGQRPTQPDLFETANGVRTQATPTLESKLPPGKMRAEHTTQFDLFGREPDQYELAANTGRPVQPNRTVEGRMVPKGKVSSTDYKQGEFDLQSAEHQASFDLSAPVPTPTHPEPSVQALRHALADAQKVTEGDTIPKVEEVVSAMGDTEKGGFISAVKRFLNPFGEGNTDVAKQLFSTYNPKGFLSDSKVIGNGRAAQLAPYLQKQFDNLTKTVGGLARVNRLTPEALAIAKKNAEDQLLREHGNSLNASILDQKFEFIPAEMHPANTPFVVLKLGKPGGALFDTENEAKLWASERYHLSNAIPFRVDQQGYKYYLGVPKSLDETSPDVLRATITDYNSANKSFWTALLGRLRTASDLLGDFQNDQRQIAVHAEQTIKALLKKEIQDNITSLKPKERAALADMLTVMRDGNHPVKNQRGFWYQTAGQYEQAFLDKIGRLPSEKEVLAYHKYRELQDWELLVENASVYRDKARKGVEQHRFSLGDGNYSPWFEGKVREGTPWSSEGRDDYEAGIWLHDATTGKGKFYYQNRMTPDEKKTLKDLVESRGYRVVQVHDPKTHPLEDIAVTKAGKDLREQVNYIVTNSWDKKPLSWNQVEYREGPHSIYRHDWYVAQPQIQTGRFGKKTYFGDNNILNVETEAQARKWSAIVDRGRQLLRDGKMDELTTYLRDNLPVEWNTAEKFSRLFDRKDSPLDLHTPVVFKKANHNTVDTVESLKRDYPDLVNGLKNPHDMSNDMDKALLLERDFVINTIKDGAVAHIAPAEQLDPYVALNKALNQRIRNLWMNDYKLQAVNSWIQDFKHVLDPNSKTLEHFPLKFLYEPQYAHTAGTMSADRQSAEAARLAIVNFIGTKTELGQNLDWMKTKLLNGIYNKIGQGKILDSALATTSDPVHFMRGLAFHSKLGMFNPVQFVVQAQTMFHSVAVAGLRHGFSGMAVAPLLRGLGHNPDHLDAIARVASRFGWTEDSFKEMWRTMEKTGLWEVAGEAAMRDNAYDPKLFQGRWGRFLDAGAFFFNEGERMTRLTSWATAFHEFKAANPTKAIGNLEIGQILRRADDLSVNMTRASNAAWQTGVWSIPTQFFAYNTRMMEQLLGSRLTKIEKLRLVATYSALYGIPIGVGTYVGGVWPAHDSFREAALAKGVDLHNDWIKIASEGLMSYVISLALGKDYNVAQRYGPGNQQALKEMLDGDKSIADMVFGASGKIAADFFKAAMPFFHWAAATVTGEDYPLMPTDWTKMFRNVATFDEAAKAYGVLNYGQWQSKSGQAFQGADAVDAVAISLGLTPQRVSDTYSLQNILRKQKSEQEGYVNNAREDFRRALQAASEGDYKAAQSYRERAQASFQAAHLSFSDQQRVYHQLLNSNRDPATSVRWELFQHADPTEARKMFDTYIKGNQ